MGFEIEMDKIKQKVNRAQSIINFPPPKNGKELQRLLGMASYDRLFIPKITDSIKPLYELLEKERKFIWDINAEYAFMKLSANWKKNYVNIPDIKSPYELETDASNFGIRAVLRQRKNPIAYISRCLTKAKRNYSITEKEVLAVRWSMEKLRFYLQGVEFLLITDHKAIEEMKNKKEFGSGRVHRWFERLERFQFKIQYRKESEKVVPDALS